MKVSLFFLSLIIYFLGNSQGNEIRTRLTFTALSQQLHGKNVKIKIRRFQPDSSVMYAVIREDIFWKESMTINLTHEEPFFAILEVYKNDTKIAHSPTFLISGPPLTVDLKKGVFETIVKGGENDFFYKNTLLFLEIPATIVSEKGYSRKAIRQAEEGDFSMNPMLKLKYQEFERNSLNTIRQYKELYFTLDKLYQKKDYFSTKTLEAGLNILNKKYKNTTVSKKLEEYILSTKDLFVGKKMPAFKVKDAEDKEIDPSLSYQDSEYTLIDVWASWCIPCRVSMKQISAMYDTTEKAKLQIISVSIDENKSSWLNAMKQDNVTWKSYIDTMGMNGEVAKTFAITSIPRNVLIDRKGKIIAINIWDRNLANFLEAKK